MSFVCVRRKKKDRTVQRGFNVRKAISKGKLRAHFPLHDKVGPQPQQTQAA
jgi:hypothetical protein